MSLPSIVRWPAQVLTTPAHRVEVFGPELAALLDLLRDTMPKAKGIGLAAPQLGVPFRVAVALDRRGPIERVVELVNPEVACFAGSPVVSLREGCLSLPGEWHQVLRYSKVLVRYQDRRGERHFEEADGEFAQVLQHEADHLEGVLLLHHLKPTRRRDVERRFGVWT